MRDIGAGGVIVECNSAMGAGNGGALRMGVGLRPESVQSPAQMLVEMAKSGWDELLVPLVRFWEGERSRERLLAGVRDRNERDLLEYVYDTYFAPLMDHTPVVLDPLAMADGFVRKHKVRPHCRKRRSTAGADSDGMDSDGRLLPSSELIFAVYFIFAALALVELC